MIFFTGHILVAFEFTINILVAGRQSETRNGRVGKCKTTAKVAAACETSTRIGSTARSFPRAFRPGRMSKFNTNRTYAKKTGFLQ